MDESISKELLALNATVRFAIVGPSFRENQRTGRMVQTDNGHVTCELFDLTTRQPYAFARGADEQSALLAAIEMAKRSPKPLTPAQMADVAAGRVPQDDAAAKLAAANERIRELEEAVAAGQKGHKRRTMALT